MEIRMITLAACIAIVVCGLIVSAVLGAVFFGKPPSRADFTSYDAYYGNLLKSEHRCRAFVLQCALVIGSLCSLVVAHRYEVAFTALLPFLAIFETSAIISTQLLRRKWGFQHHDRCVVATGLATLIIAGANTTLLSLPLLVALAAFWLCDLVLNSLATS
jgi:hypothetical protein